MIIRQHYINKIKPFIGTDLVKVLTGIRRCGKSVMLNQLMDTVRASGVSDEKIIYINFENMSNSHLCTAEALHSEVMTAFENKSGKKYLFFEKNHHNLLLINNLNLLETIHLLKSSFPSLDNHFVIPIY